MRDIMTTTERARVRERVYNMLVRQHYLMIAFKQTIIFHHFAINI
jgi:hypothetical protein